MAQDDGPKFVPPIPTGDHTQVPAGPTANGASLTRAAMTHSPTSAAGIVPSQTARIT